MRGTEGTVEVVGSEATDGGLTATDGRRLREGERERVDWKEVRGEGDGLGEGAAFDPFAFF